MSIGHHPDEPEWESPRIKELTASDREAARRRIEGIQEADSASSDSLTPDPVESQ